MKSKNMNGMVFNIQRFSLHDGPGIRTTVFLKGCPLSCLWCCNPESQQPDPEPLVYSGRCNSCGKCQHVCQVNAIVIGGEGIIIDRDKCTLCMKCAEVCPTRAIVVSGQYLTVKELVSEIERDELFYQNSGGGMTISGGEPLMQGEFTYQLLKACKERGLHTALDTCGYASWRVMKRALEFTDLVLFDIKHINTKKHLDGTGKENNLILSNAQKLQKTKVKTWLRVPLIPGYNASGDNLRAVAQLAKEMNVEKVSILPYHEWGKSKYKALNRCYSLEHKRLLTDERVRKIKEIIEGYKLSVSISN